ncbi:hypothetical protein CERSUDRAFT_72231 [Gelatoporia subvermispora B]|uniref:F-box domain-containing protein n=1 Tax=Ceriporiopsis subvermispora (strain B) TaxID=914234 RepID=M2QPL5_CERS8|nr:hypothetical protein CERSUDRAFT_72231 [Gelatoporia subvermispora B]
MHHCLQIAEILSIIIGYISKSDSLGRATLAALARTCRLFHGPALDVLWRHQDNLLNLLKCLPGDAWMIEGRQWVRENHMSPETTVVPLSLTRPLEPTDWRRLAPSVFLEFTLRQASSALLPSLRRLIWDFDLRYEIPIQFTRFLVHSGLESLYLNLEAWDTLEIESLSVLLSLPTSCPNLQHLTLSGSCAIPSAIVRVLPRLRCLHALTLPCGMGADLVALLHSLQAIPALNTLRLQNAWGPEGVGAPVSLEEKLPTPPRPPQSEKLSEALVTLEQCCDQSVLETLEIIDETEEEHPGHVDSIRGRKKPYSIKHLEPLLSFSNLGEVKISLNANLMLDDAALERMKLSWT